MTVSSVEMLEGGILKEGVGKAVYLIYCVCNPQHAYPISTNPGQPPDNLPAGSIGFSTGFPIDMFTYRGFSAWVVSNGNLKVQPKRCEHVAVDEQSR